MLEYLRSTAPAVPDPDRVTMLLVYLWAPFANLLCYANTVVMGSLSLLLWPFDRTGAMQFWCARCWCRFIAWSIFARIRVHGVEHIRAGQAYVYMANHSSLLDTLALFVSLPYPFRIMAKRELFFLPFMGWHLWTAGHFPTGRGGDRRAVRNLRRVVDRIVGGASLTVFPEGTRTPDGCLQPFKSRPFKVAIAAGVPIVPVTIRGSFKLLPRTTLAPRPGRIDVILGEPIETRDYDKKRLNELIDRTTDVIRRTLGDEKGA